MIEMAGGGRELVETIVALVVVVGGAVFSVIAFLTNPARHGPDASAHAPGASTPAARPESEAAPAVRRSIALIAAALSGGAAVIHLVAAPPHYAEIGDLASGFVAAAAFQGWWALRARGGLTPRLIDVGIAVNVAIVAAWAWTRSVGLPVGELAGRPEAVGFPDAVCTAFEVLLVGVLLVARSGLDSGGRRSVVGSACGVDRRGPGPRPRARADVAVGIRDRERARSRRDRPGDVRPRGGPLRHPAARRRKGSSRVRRGRGP